MVDENLTLHSEQLLVDLFAAWGQLPQTKRYSFDVMSGRIDTIVHSALPGWSRSANQETLDELETAGLIRLSKGLAYAEYRRYITLTSRGRERAEAARPKRRQWFAPLNTIIAHPIISGVIASLVVAAVLAAVALLF